MSGASLARWRIDQHGRWSCLARSVCARLRGLLPALGGDGLQDRGAGSAVSIIDWLPARRHLHAVDGSHRFCDRRAAQQRRMRRRAWEWACRRGRSLKLLRRSSLSERLFAFALERTHLSCTVIDSERYRVCINVFRPLNSPKYSRDQTPFWPQVLSHGEYLM